LGSECDTEEAGDDLSEMEGKEGRDVDKVCGEE
jgi:hypothetical protein